MEWEIVMNDLYVKSGGKAAVLEEVKQICKGIDGEIGDQRNKRQQFFEKLLDRPDGDGYLIINHVEAWKKDLGGQNNTTLDMVLDEWDSQRIGAVTHDTLYHVLCKRNEPIEYRCSALLKLAKRIRGGQDAYNSNAFVAHRIIKRARAVYKIHEKRGDLGRARDYGPTPVEYIGLSLEYQYLFNLVRFGEMNEVVEKAENLEAKINKISELRKLDWRPDIRLKWWTWQCRLRAAAFCLDTDLWIKAKEKLEELEDEAKKDSAYGLAENLEELKVKEHEGSMKTGARRRYLERISEFLSSWHEFVNNDEDASNYRQLRRGGEKDEWKRKRAKEIMELSSDFSHGIKGFLQILHTDPTNVPSIVKHSHNTTTEEKLIRSQKMLSEISHAHHATVVLGTERTFFVLEILHRLLIYRLWWESLNYIGRDEKEGDQFDVSCSCFNIVHAEKILDDIRVDLERLGTPCEDGCREIVSSIKMVRGLVGSSPSKITDDMRGHLDELDSSGHRQWGVVPNHDVHLGDWHENFLGLWYMRDESGADSYETPDPLMRAIGMWKTDDEEWQDPSDEFDESDPLYIELKKWRDRKAKEDDLIHYQIAWDSTLKEIVVKRPENHSDLLQCKGIGERKLELYGDEILDIIKKNSPGSG